MFDEKRYDVLKAKVKEVKFFGLSSEEKKEYRMLKEIAEKSEPTFTKEEAAQFDGPPVKLFDGPEDRLTKLEKMVERLSAENSNLREESSKLQDGWSDYESPAGANKTATIKFYQKDADSPKGVIVKAVVFKDNEFNEETHKYDKLVYTIDVRYDDGKEESLKIDAVELAKIREIEKVEIIKEDKKTLRKVEDYITIPERDKAGYPKRMLSGGSGYGQNVGKNQVPLEVFMVKSICTVKRKNGQEFQIDNDFLNL